MVILHIHLAKLCVLLLEQLQRLVFLVFFATCQLLDEMPASYFVVTGKPEGALGSRFYLMVPYP